MQRSIRLEFFLALAVILACASLHGASRENWPRFRGPNGQGHSAEKGLPTHWNASSNVAWKTAIPGEGWSSPIVWDGKIFLTSVTDNATKCHVIAVDAKTGTILWNKP